MSQTPRLSPEEQKLALLEKRRAQEILHSIIVKIISWRAGLQEGASVKKDNKITPLEWKSYKDHVFNMYKADGPDKAHSKIGEAEKAIKDHGGFQ